MMKASGGGALQRRINIGTRCRFAFYIPQIQMIEDLFCYLTILYHGDDFHFCRTLGTDQRVNFPGSGPRQAAIFCIKRAQFLLKAFEVSSGSKTVGMSSSVFAFLRRPRDTLL